MRTIIKATFLGICFGFVAAWLSAQFGYGIFVSIIIVILLSFVYWFYLD